MGRSAKDDDALTGARPLAGSSFGWEAMIDLAVRRSRAERQALLRIFRRDGFLVLRNQRLTMDRQIAIAGIFGPTLPRGVPDHCIVSNVVDDAQIPTVELPMHVDNCYLPIPYIGGVMHALEVSDGCEPTLFANAMNGWDRLGERLRARLDGLNIINVASYTEDGWARPVATLEPGTPVAVHPAVGRQPEGGRKFIFANRLHTAQLLGLPEAESTSLLREVFDCLYAPEHIYEHRWRTGDLIIWDNRAIQHARGEIVGTQPRTLQRTSFGDLGYWQQVPTALPRYQHARAV